jgi:hypothetical protein
MSAYVHETRPAWPALGRSLWTLLTHLALAIDASVRVRAARAMPEWRMREVQSQMITRYGRPAGQG